MKKIMFYLIIIISFSFNMAFAFDFNNMQKITYFAIDKTEISIEQFSIFAKATNFISKAEKVGGGLVYSFGWKKKIGWTWKTPYGKKPNKNEPVVHINYDEATEYCKWKDKRLPSEIEWIEAAYTERRLAPKLPFIKNKTYPYPTGSNPNGANCLSDCGLVNHVDYSNHLSRGGGHSLIGTTKAGVNGLFDMGANVWEWVDIHNDEFKGTKGGSWWYGKTQMHSSYRAEKPRDMAVVYVGFRCVKDLN